MLHYFLEKKLSFILVILLSIIASLLDIGVAFFIKGVIDSVSTMDLQRMFMITMITVIYIVLVILSDFFAHYSRERFCKKVSYAVKRDLISTILSMPIMKKEEKSYSEYQSLIINDVETLEDNYFDAILSLMYQVLNLVFSFIAILFIQPLFLPVIFIICLIPMIFPYFTKNKLEALQQDKSINRSNFIKKLTDVLNGFRSIKSYHAEKEYEKYSNEASDLYTNSDIKLAKRSNIMMSSAYGVGLLIILFTWVFGAFFIKAELLTFSSLVAITKIAETIAGPFQIIGERYSGIRSSASIRKRVIAMLSYNKKEDINLHFHSIQMENVKILKEEKTVLTVDNLVLNEYDRVLLLGESGAGKSTLLNLLAGFEFNIEGVIKADDRILDHKNNLMNSSILIEQYTYIFDTSLADNISMFDRKKEEKVEDVLISLKMDKLLYDRKEQKKFSGGEKRRIDLGRLLLTDISEKIILLDEPFAGLDPENIKNVTNIINNLHPKLLIVAGHHKEVYENLNCNRVLEIKEAKISEE